MRSRLKSQTLSMGCKSTGSRVTKCVVTNFHRFLLAQIYFSSLDDKPTAKAIKNALARFQKQNQGSSEDEKLKVLSCAYDQAMARINGQKPGFRQFANKILAWITCAKRPLTVSELQHALAVEVGELKLDNDNIPQIEDAVSMCAGLVTVDEDSGIIRLVHYTTQEYFEQTQKHWFPDAEADITTICVTYLLFSIFGSGVCQTDAEFDDRLCSNRLYDYAAHNWGHHARKAIPSQIVLDFLESKANVEASSQALMAVKRWTRHAEYSQQFPMQMTGLHLAAYFGLENSVRVILGTTKPDLKDSYGRTPLSWAAAEGHAAVVQLLLEKSADLGARDEEGRTPLSFAAQRGNHSVVQLLLEKGANIESKDDQIRTPLSWAAVEGHVAVVRLLLEKGADLGAKDEEGRTPLSFAAKGGHDTVIKVFLAGNEVDVNSRATGKGNTGWTPLSFAAHSGRETVAKLLLAVKGVEADSRDGDSRTPLSLAAEAGHEAVVKLLLAAKGVETDSRDENGRTPLSFAAEMGHETVVELLLAEEEIEADSRDSFGQTPLSWAADNRQDAVMKLLLATKRVDPNSKDGWRRTPLVWAVESGCETAVKLLLMNGAKCEFRDEYGNSLLWLAALRGYESVVMLLLEDMGLTYSDKINDGRTHPADGKHKSTTTTPEGTPALNAYRALLTVFGRRQRKCLLKRRDERDTPPHAGDDKPNGKGVEQLETILSFASEKGHNAVVQLLLAQDGIDSNFKDHRGMTPLSLAAQSGHDYIVSLLLENRVDASSRATDYFSAGQTALSLAAEKGHENVVKLLLEAGKVDGNSRDDKGCTPLQHAARNGYEAVVKHLLATNNVDPNSTDICGRTPLSESAQRGHIAVVKLLLGCKADPNTEDTWGVTPLSQAAQNGHEAVVDLLLDNKADPNSKCTYFGRTHLSSAADRGHEAVVKLFLDTDKVDAHSEDCGGRTPL
jgi:ankyrin repeat protein